MRTPLLIRDVMRIGVPTCKLDDPAEKVAGLMLDQAATALIVLDKEADTRGWINEARLARVYLRLAAAPSGSDPELLTAADIMDDEVPEAPSDLPLLAAAHLMEDMGVDHLFMLHHAAGRAWPASVVSLRDLVRAMAGSHYLATQGAAASRLTPMDLFRQRHGLPKR